MAAIEVNEPKHTIQESCTVLSFPRSTYYAAKNHKTSKQKLYHKYLKEQITKIYHESHDIYGTPKIHYILNHQGDHASLKLVQKIMRELGLRSKTVRKWRPGPTTMQKLDQFLNLIKQDFSITSLNQKWVTDITYIYTVLDGWCYLSSIQDLHSKKIIAHCFSKNMTVDLCLQTLKAAFGTQKTSKEKLILHSDMGSQYTSNMFNEALKQLGIKHSYSRKGCPYDNTTIESFHASLKKEEVYLHTYKNFESAKIICKKCSSRRVYKGYC